VPIFPGEREVEVLGLLEPEVADHRREHARALQLPVGQVLRLERLVEHRGPSARSRRVALEPRILLRARDQATEPVA
jgi:hypothetical protein